MKLNFWQILGIIMVVVAGIYLIVRETTKSSPSSPREPAPAATQAQ